MAIKIIVPYRDSGDGVRAQHLSSFLGHFDKLGWDISIYVIEQSKQHKFNRGTLLNIGASLYGEDGDFYIFHDVDLLPDASLKPLYMSVPAPKQAIHLGSLWTTKYSFPDFFGGVVAIRHEDFQRANGFPNKCWGWGGEDDILRARLLATDTTIARPQSTDRITRYTEMYHEHQGDSPATKNMQRWEDVEKYSQDRSDGVSSVDAMIDTLQIQPLHARQLPHGGSHILVDLDYSDHEKYLDA